MTDHVQESAGHRETPEQFRGLHRVLTVVAAVFFGWLVVEGAVIVPWFFWRYGTR
jgi:hypothetical protein